MNDKVIAEYKVVEAKYELRCTSGFVHWVIYCALNSDRPIINKLHTVGKELRGHIRHLDRCIELNNDPVLHDYKNFATEILNDVVLANLTYYRDCAAIDRYFSI